MLKVTYHGHAVFVLDDGNHRVIIDPFLNGNPSAKIKPSDVDVSAVLVTHGHGDHLGDAVEISKRCGAPVVGPFELVGYCQGKGAEGHPMHIGGSHEFEFGRVKLTIAHHGSSTPDGVYTGQPCGFLVTMGGKTVYHAGDTALFYDMKLLGEMNSIDAALLPVGDNFTMGPEDAAKAVELLKPRKVIPMHYGTFPVLERDPSKFVEKVKNMGIEVIVLSSGESAEI